MKKIAVLLLCMLLICAPAALADIQWPDHPTPGQQALEGYVTAANAALLSAGEGQIDIAYEMYSTFASLGMNGAMVPEDFTPGFALDVEMHFRLSDSGLHSLTLRVSDIHRFAPIAAACLHASSPSAIAYDQAYELTSGYAAIAISDAAAAQANPREATTHSFEEDVVDLQGNQPRAYFAYYPNQYGDGVTWLQMTLVFARPGSADAMLVLSATPAPTASDDMYEGYFAQDNYTHLEVFASPTPEPDSAAME